MLVKRDTRTGRFLSTQTLEERFWEKVDKKSEDECWGWLASHRKFGYGQLWVKNICIPASRASWIIHYGEIPKGMYVCHHCDNPGCVNPKHLFLGTPKDNSQDMIKKGRFPNQKGENNYGSKLTNKDVQNIRIMWKSSKYKQKELMQRFNISRTTLWRITSHRNWVVEQDIK